MRILLVLFTILLIGCGPSSPPTETTSLEQKQPVTAAASSGKTAPADGAFATGRDANTITINGWKIVYPKALQAKEISMIDDVLKIGCGKFTFEVRDNTIFVDGKSFGPGSSGDTVQIGMHGEIAVNGELRTLSE